jgi:hypothetical protein
MQAAAMSPIALDESDCWSVVWKEIEMQKDL